jgi:hypothetical protein
MLGVTSDPTWSSVIMSFSLVGSAFAICEFSVFVLIVVWSGVETGVGAGVFLLAVFSIFIC